MKDHGGSATAVNTERRLITLNGNGNAQRMGYGRWNGELLEDQDHGFRAGDLVWAKIKSQPWWPGQVYDPRDASELALKHSREGCVLVCLFGDDSCSWCLPLQLVPLVENHERMWSERPSRSFEKAVHRAFDEIGRLMELKILCRCISLEKRGDLARPMAMNVGVKAGSLVPEVDIDRLPIPQYEPADIRAKLVRFASTASFDSVLDLMQNVEVGGLLRIVYKRKRLRTAIGGGFKDDNSLPNEIEYKAEPSTARERKKSKYLSPPYTNLNGIGYKPRFEMRKSSFLEELDDEKASEKDKMISLASDVEVEVNELMLRLKSAAVDHSYLRNEGHLGSICSFASAYRSSAYLHGSHFKTYHRCKKVSRKRKKLTGSPKVLRLTGSADGPTDSLVLDARLIGKRVDSMAKMLESCVSRFSSDDKARLREEMKGLIEKVVAASDKVRLMAERAPLE
ncbi:hypothetical protein SASPL_139677 [Salvia splendens]|uniref:PWWP domain-containing protein n=1 Tax=Salvia splendens TaxID=180675 RepID=A0A8X8ZB73_SALSN|nr:hypothetical protein SASPL_139677 [Salvia splendens]